MAYATKILADSISEAGDRLTTMEVTFPRLVLAEFNTHRVFSRNSASSRAIPVAKQLRRVLDDPFVPEKFGRNQAGMQSFAWLDGLKHDEALRIWLRNRDRAATGTFELLLGERLSGEVFGYDFEREFASIDMLNAGFDEAIRLLDPKHRAEDLADTEILDVHKQITNRGLETYMWHTVIVTATEWSNFFALRAHENAQAEIRSIAEEMLGLYEVNQPNLVRDRQWHLPLIQPEEHDGVFEFSEEARKISAARCARVSYLTHDGKRDPSVDLTLYARLVNDGHMSPLEHVATPFRYNETGFKINERGVEFRAERTPAWSGNFHGWKQFRKFIPHEDDYSRVKKA